MSHEFDAYGGAGGQACTHMVIEDGDGVECGLPHWHPVHYEPICNERGVPESECPPHCRHDCASWGQVKEYVGMTTTEALAEVHRHFCAKDGAHDDACVALTSLAIRAALDDRTHGGNHAPLSDGVHLDPGFCDGCDIERSA